MLKWEVDRHYTAGIPDEYGSNVDLEDAQVFDNKVLEDGVKDGM